MAEMRYSQALNQALRDSMQQDASVILLGEDIGAAGGSFKISRGLLEEFGAERVRQSRHEICLLHEQIATGVRFHVSRPAHNEWHPVSAFPGIEFEAEQVAVEPVTGLPRSLTAII